MPCMARFRHCRWPGSWPESFAWQPDQPPWRPITITGAGSLILSHVNDAGFWLVKEYFNMSVGETFKTWTLMETLISVVAIIFIMLLNLVV